MYEDSNSYVPALLNKSIDKRFFEQMTEQRRQSMSLMENGGKLPTNILTNRSPETSVQNNYQ
jgi:hypothetical protein